MYFGDFLVQKKLITSAQLIEALCYQLEHLPSLIRLIHESKLISSDELLDIIKMQIKQDVDIVQVLSQKGRLNQDQINSILQTQMAKRIHLGEVLVELKILDRPTLEKSLDDYFLQKETVNPAPAVESESDISDAALDSLRELGIDVSGLTDLKQEPSIPQSVAPTASHPASEDFTYFTTTFSEKQKNKLLKLIDIIEDSQSKSQDLSNYFNSLFKDIHLLKGAIVFSEFDALENSIVKIDSSLDQALASGEVAIQSWCKKFLEPLRKYVQQLWLVRNDMMRLSSRSALKNDLQSVIQLQQLTYEL